MSLTWQIELLDWADSHVLEIATVALAIVTVWATLRSTRHDSREREHERRYARIVQAQSALRLSATLAAEYVDSWSWRAKAVPVLMAALIGIGTATNRWSFGRGVHLLTLIATSRHVGADSIQNTKAYAFLQSAYDVAGLLGQIGPQMPPSVIARLQVSTGELHKGQGALLSGDGSQLRNYIDAVNDAHLELDRIVREEHLEGRSQRLPLLTWMRRRRFRAASK